MSTSGTRLGAARPLEFTQGKFLPQHLLIQEQQRIERLILRRCRHVTFRRQMGQETPHLRLAHFLGMPLVAPDDESANPIAIRLFGAPRELRELQKP